MQLCREGVWEYRFVARYCDQAVCGFDILAFLGLELWRQVGRRDELTGILDYYWEWQYKTSWLDFQFMIRWSFFGRWLQTVWSCPYSVWRRMSTLDTSRSRRGQTLGRGRVWGYFSLWSVLGSLRVGESGSAVEQDFKLYTALIGFSTGDRLSGQDPTYAACHHRFFDWFLAILAR